MNSNDPKGGTAADLIPCVVRPGQLWRAEKNYGPGEAIHASQATIDQHPWVFEKIADRDQRLLKSRVTVLAMPPERARAAGVEPGSGGIERYEVVRLDPDVPRRAELEDKLRAQHAELEKLRVELEAARAAKAEGEPEAAVAGSLAGTGDPSSGAARAPAPTTGDTEPGRRKK